MGNIRRDRMEQCVEKEGKQGLQRRGGWRIFQLDVDNYKRLGDGLGISRRTYNKLTLLL